MFRDHSLCSFQVLEVYSMFAFPLMPEGKKKMFVTNGPCEKKKPLRYCNPLIN